MITEKQMAELMAELEATYPEGTFVWRDNPAVALRVWHRSLGDLPHDVVTAAVRRWMDTEPKLPHISDIRGLIAAAVNPIPSEGEVYGRRYAYFRHGRGEPMTEGDTFAFRVFADIGTPADCGQMSPDDLREAVTWAYKRIAAGEKSERTARVSETLQPVAAAPRLKAVGS